MNWNELVRKNYIEIYFVYAKWFTIYKMRWIIQIVVIIETIEINYLPHLTYKKMLELSH